MLIFISHCMYHFYDVICLYTVNSLSQASEILGLSTLPLMLAKHPTGRRMHGLNHHWEVFTLQLQQLQRGIRSIYLLLVYVYIDT